MKKYPILNATIPSIVIINAKKELPTNNFLFQFPSKNPSTTTIKIIVTTKLISELAK